MPQYPHLSPAPFAFAGGDVGVLLLQGRQDRLVSASAAPQIIAKVASIDKELIWLENTGHIVSVDSERQEVFIRCAAFIRGRCQGPAPKSVGSVPANR